MSVADCTRNPEVEYRPVVGFPGYEVGSDGTVWSCWKRGPRTEMTTSWRRISEMIVADSRPYKAVRYHWVRFHRDKKCNIRAVHRVVLEAFRGMRPDGMQARHLDGNAENNSLDNLCWGTPAENTDDKRRHGTILIGVENGKAKITPDDVRSIRSLLRAKVSHVEIADMFGVTRGCVGGIAYRTSWTHVE